MSVLVIVPSAMSAEATVPSFISEVVMVSLRMSEVVIVSSFISAETTEELAKSPSEISPARPEARLAPVTDLPAVSEVS